MNFPEIKVHLLSKSVPDRAAIERWVREMGCGGEEHVVPGPEEATDAEVIVAYAAKRCYKSFEPRMNPNVAKVRKDLTKFFDNILRSKHGSTLEHVTWTFAFENVTRVFTGEMNRHRAGVAISEGSMRYISFDDIPFWMPLSLILDEDNVPERDTPEFAAWDKRRVKQAETQCLIQDALREVQKIYGKMCEVWDISNPDMPFEQKKKLTSMFRRILPMGTCTGGVWTMNARAMRHIIETRTSPAAEEEIACVFSQVAQLMVESEPKLFGDFVNQDGAWVPQYSKV